MKRVAKWVVPLLWLSCLHAAEDRVNLLTNPGFDEPSGRGWNARGKPITLDLHGADARHQLQIMLSYNGRARWGTYPSTAKDGQLIFPGQNAPVTDLFTGFYSPELMRREREWRAGRWRP